MLQRKEACRRHDVLTLDESWFDSSTDRKRIWLAPEQSVPDREHHMTEFAKLMLMVAWGPRGFRVLPAFQRGVEFNTGNSTMEILKGIKNR
jgi:hypothetical protein